MNERKRRALRKVVSSRFPTDLDALLNNPEPDETPDRPRCRIGSEDIAWYDDKKQYQLVYLSPGEDGKKKAAELGFVEAFINDPDGTMGNTIIDLITGKQIHP